MSSSAAEGIAPFPVNEIFFRFRISRLPTWPPSAGEVHVPYFAVNSESLMLFLAPTM